MAITDWPASERPREKLLNNGAGSLSDAELLAIFLRVGMRGKTALDLARDLISHYGNLKSLLSSSEIDFCSLPGMGPAKFVQLQASLEMSKRYFHDEMRESNAITNPNASKLFLRSALADKKHEIFDEDLQALVSDATVMENEHVRLISLKVCSETGETPEATLTLSVDDEETQVQMSGSGPVDAAYKAIEEIVQSNTELELYSVNNITSGTDSQGEVNVRLEKGGRIVSGQGADTDIVIASAKAYINALNKILVSVDREHPQV